MGDGFGFACLVCFADEYTGEPVAANPGVPVHAGGLPPVVFGERWFENSVFHLFVDTFANVGGKGIQLFFEHISGPYDETGRLGIKQVDFLNVRQRDMFAVVCRYAPPRLFTEAAYSINDSAGKPPFALYDFCHHESSKVPTLLETDALIVHPVAVDFVLGKDRPRQHGPRGVQILFAIADITLAHLLGNGVTPECIVCLREQTTDRQTDCQE